MNLDISTKKRQHPDSKHFYLLHILHLALQGAVALSFSSVETLRTGTVSVIPVRYGQKNLSFNIIVNSFVKYTDHKIHFRKNYVTLSTLKCFCFFETASNTSVKYLSYPTKCS